jgi:glutamate transport system substrate-binding protein
MTQESEPMRIRWWAGMAVVVLVAAGCGGNDGGGAIEEPGNTATSAPTQEEPPTFPAGTTMAALQQKGKIVVGTTFDQRGFGLKDPKTGEVMGFDAEMAELIANAIFGGAEQEEGQTIEFVEAKSKDREVFIEQGKVDIVVATYTINDERKARVDFAGPYFIARQDIMVKADDNSIKSVEDLNGKKVCSVQGSTSLKNLMAKAPRADTSITFDIYSKCADAMGDGRVDAVTTDDAILAGLVKDSGGKYKLLGAPFTDEPYGIGLKKGDTAFRNFLNDVIEDSYQNGEWKKGFEETLGKDGLPLPQPPAVVRY